MTLYSYKSSHEGSFNMCLVKIIVKLGNLLVHLLVIIMKHAHTTYSVSVNSTIASWPLIFPFLILNFSIKY